jgi:hypothetical protein
MHDVFVDQITAANMLNINKDIISDLIKKDILKTRKSGVFGRLIYLSSISNEKRKKGNAMLGEEAVFLELEEREEMEGKVGVEILTENKQVKFASTSNKKKEKNWMGEWRNRIKTEAVESGYVDLPFKAIGSGYWILLDSKKNPKIREHRYVVQQHHKIKLKSYQAVHHINGDKLDNRIENLQIVSFSQHGKLNSKKMEAMMGKSTKLRETNFAVGRF